MKTSSFFVIASLIETPYSWGRLKMTWNNKIQGIKIHKKKGIDLQMHADPFYGKYKGFTKMTRINTNEEK